MKVFVVIVLLGTIVAITMGILSLRRHALGPVVVAQAQSNSPGSSDQVAPSNPSVQTPVSGSTDIQPTISPTVTVPSPAAEPVARHQSDKVADSNPSSVSANPGHPIQGEDQGSQPIVSEADARSALDYVGMDSFAEEVWLTAINDPNLSESARQNLIEDLNENGLSDPDHPTMDDLPLIQSRLALIEDVGPDAMDEVNLAAFGEAYKDLSDMQRKLIGR